MKSIIFSIVLLLCTLFSVQAQLTFSEIFRKAEVWNADSNKFVRSPLYASPNGYVLYTGKDNQDSLVFSIIDIADSTKYNQYKVYEDVSKEPSKLHWIYRAREMNTGENCYIHHIRTSQYHILRIEYDYYTLRYYYDRSLER
jgi:hypothetical protein